MIAPIFQAELKYKNELTEGYLIEDEAGNMCIRACLSNSDEQYTDFDNDYGIKPETLKISFDGGKTFDGISEVARAIEYVKHLLEVWDI